MIEPANYEQYHPPVVFGVPFVPRLASSQRGRQILCGGRIPMPLGAHYLHQRLDCWWPTPVSWLVTVWRKRLCERNVNFGSRNAGIRIFAYLRPDITCVLSAVAVHQRDGGGTPPPGSPEQSTLANHTVSCNLHRLKHSYYHVSTVWWLFFLTRTPVMQRCRSLHTRCEESMFFCGQRGHSVKRALRYYYMLDYNYMECIGFDRS